MEILVRTRRFSEGDCFAVPLPDGGFTIGLIARMGSRSALFAYFFGRHYTKVPNSEDLPRLAAHDAILAGQVGRTDLNRGLWPVIGPVPNWQRSEWPVLPLVRYEELSGRSFLVTYSDDDPGIILKEEQIDQHPGDKWFEDGTMGAGYVEGRLGQLLT